MLPAAPRSAPPFCAASPGKAQFTSVRCAARIVPGRKGVAAEPPGGKLMADSDKKFTGSIPDIYDEYLVPLIFEPYARAMARRVASALPADILETAAGSGVVTRALAPILRDGARYVVTDLNPPMLERAKRQQPSDARIAWQATDAMALPFGDGAFDAVCCQFGVMFLPDKAQGYREARRVLREGGTFVFNVWDRIEFNEFPHCVTETTARFFPDNPPRFLARTPHGHHDVDAILADLVEVGFGRVEVETITEVSRAQSPRDPAVAFCQGTPLRNELEARDAARLEEVTEAAARDIEARFGAGPVEGNIRGHVFVAVK